MFNDTILKTLREVPARNRESIKTIDSLKQNRTKQKLLACKWVTLIRVAIDNLVHSKEIKGKANRDRRLCKMAREAVPSV